MSDFLSNKIVVVVVILFTLYAALLMQLYSLQIAKGAYNIVYSI